MLLRWSAAASVPASGSARCVSSDDHVPDEDVRSGGRLTTKAVVSVVPYGEIAAGEHGTAAGHLGLQSMSWVCLGWVGFGCQAVPSNSEDGGTRPRPANESSGVRPSWTTASTSHAIGLSTLVLAGQLDHDPDWS